MGPPIKSKLPPPASSGMEPLDSHTNPPTGNETTISRDVKLPEADPKMGPQAHETLIRLGRGLGNHEKPETSREVKIRKTGTPTQSTETLVQHPTTETNLPQLRSLEIFSNPAQESPRTLLSEHVLRQTLPPIAAWETMSQTTPPSIDREALRNELIDLIKPHQEE